MRNSTFSKKTVSLPLEKRNNMTDEQINVCLQNNFVVMTQEQYHYLQQTRQYHQRLCCRQQFVIGEKIDQAESSRYQYKMYNYPFEIENKEILLRTIVSFLNSEGGYIFIGIKQTGQKKRIIAGLVLCQQEKQQIIKQIRVLISCIKPDVIIEKKIQTFFIPVKAHHNGNFMDGRYIIRIQVQQGNPQQLYHFKTEAGSLYYHRYHDECLIIPKQLRKNQIEFRKTLSNYIFPSHKCLQPHVGYPIYQSQNPTSQFYRTDDSWKNIKRFRIAIVFEGLMNHLPKIKRFLKQQKVAFEYTVLGQRFHQSYIFRIQLAKCVNDFDTKIQSLGCKIIRKQQRPSQRALNCTNNNSQLASDYPLPYGTCKVPKTSPQKNIIQISDNSQQQYQCESQQNSCEIIQNWPSSQQTKIKMVDKSNNIQQLISDESYQQTTTQLIAISKLRKKQHHNSFLIDLDTEQMLPKTIKISKYNHSIDY